MEDQDEMFRESETVDENSMESEEDGENEQGDGGKDGILNVIDGDETSDRDEESNLIFVPTVRTVTRNGRIAGTWKRHFVMDETSDDEEEEEEGNSSTESEGSSEDEDDSGHEEHTTVTRSGSRAGTWRKFVK